MCVLSVCDDRAESFQENRKEHSRIQSRISCHSTRTHTNIHTHTHCADSNRINISICWLSFTHETSPGKTQTVIWDYFFSFHKSKLIQIVFFFFQWSLLICCHMKVRAEKTRNTRTRTTTTTTIFLISQNLKTSFAKL